MTKHWNRRSFWKASIVAGLAAALYGLVRLPTVPFVPFHPRCIETEHWWWHDKIVDLKGSMKKEFVDAIAADFAIHGYEFKRVGDHGLYVTFKMRTALDSGNHAEPLFVLTRKIAWQIIYRRTGLLPHVEIPVHIYAAPHPRIEGSWYLLDECPTMRLIAMVPDGVPSFVIEDDPFWRERLTRHRYEIQRLRSDGR